jgi:cephalosporin hydroxylase
LKKPTDSHEAFIEERKRRIDSYADTELMIAAQRFLKESALQKYSYNFSWLSRPIIQYPQDIVAVQELIWRIRPDLIIETGIAHGGSVLLSASVLALLDYCDALQSNCIDDLLTPARHVLAVDIDIRSHNRLAIEAHPLSNRIRMLEGSSTAAHVLSEVRAIAAQFRTVMVFLDSNHTHQHVLDELHAYAPLVSPGSYCVVFDTVIESLPAACFADRPWSAGNNPMTAVEAFLSSLSLTRTTAADGGRLLFEVDSEIDSKLLISVAPRGYLRRLADPA